jgi:DNA recombination protein RmuC
MTIIYILLAIIIALILWFNLKADKSIEDKTLTDIKYRIDNLSAEVTRIEASVKNEISTNRNEFQKASKDTRSELSDTLRSFEGKLNNLTTTIENRLKEFNDSNTNDTRETRKELKGSLDFMREVIEKKLGDLQAGNEKKLEEMRITVDDKLQKTLETRLGESFKQVSERLEAVHKGLGDMQTLATGVGDLKRVLTNVKSRGVLGEYQLENLLEQLFTTDQYEKNVRTKVGSNAMVEFAIKMPGRNDTTVWLPIDSKFPKEDFEHLMNAYDLGNAEVIEECRKTFAKGIKKSALDICTKYIDPPNTTDFAILFLPFESLYAEVLRTPGLFESIQRECKINVAGPTTLSAFLSSLQMGFRTLAIEKRSSEVWQLLGAVKTEFGIFGGILDKTQKKLLEATNSIEKAGVRTRKIQRQLRNVQELPKPEVLNLLPEVNQIDGIEQEQSAEDKLQSNL